MRILGKDLKKIIKEEITRADIEAKRQELATTIAGGRIGSGISRWNKMHPDLDLGPMRDFFASVLAGEKTVSPLYNSPEENLYINKALSVFENRVMNTYGNKIELQSFPPSTYPESGIRRLQGMLMLTRDGIFGRQTLAAAISPLGATSLDPSVSATHLDKFVNDVSNLVADNSSMSLRDRVLSKSLLLQAIRKDPTLGGMFASPLNIAEIEQSLPDTFTHSQLMDMLKRFDVSNAMGDTPEAMEKLQSILSGPVNESASRKAASSEDSESQNITERLMERWLK
jgi:hypothetical protein